MVSGRRNPVTLGVRGNGAPLHWWSRENGFSKLVASGGRTPLHWRSVLEGPYYTCGQWEKMFITLAFRRKNTPYFGGHWGKYFTLVVIKRTDSTSVNKRSYREE